MKTALGMVIGVEQDVAIVSFTQGFPNIHDILNGETDDQVILEVIASADKSSFYCLILSRTASLCRGAKVINTKKTLTIPVGREVLGRALNVFGQPQDGKPLQTHKTRSLYVNNAVPVDNVAGTSQLLETGIKAIDFFAPLLKGGKMGLIGGAGLGKTMLLTELIHNVVISNPMNSAVSVFSAVGERSREAHELLENIAEAGVLDKTVLVIGQMGENAAIRFRTAFAAATIAEDFRDQHQDVLFFIDNMYRFNQAGYELSTAMKSIPSEDGYQPTLPSEVGQLHERLTSTKQSSITTIEAVYLPSDDISDYSVRSIFPYLDSYIVLSRDIYQEGRLPAIDLLSCSSSAMNPDTVGSQHYELYLESKKVLEQAAELERIVSLVGTTELSRQDQVIYQRSLVLKNYMTQAFFVAEPQSGVPGVSVPLKTTLSDISEILQGKFDETDPDLFTFVAKLPKAVPVQNPVPSQTARPETPTTPIADEIETPDVPPNLEKTPEPPATTNETLPKNNSAAPTNTWAEANAQTTSSPGNTNQNPQDTKPPV